MLAHLVDDGLRDVTLHQHVGTVARNESQHGAEFRVFQQVPDRPGSSKRIVKKSASGRVLLEMLLAGQ